MKNYWELSGYLFNAVMQRMENWLVVFFLFFFFFFILLCVELRANNKDEKLRDVRDGQVYRVMRMADGQLWMAENLRYGNCRELTVEDYAAGAVKVTRGVLKGKDKKSLLGVCIYQSSGKSGTNLYNWQGVMQDEYAALDSVQVNPAWQKKWQGICPEGWHLPSAEEFQTLYRMMGKELHRWLGIPDDYVYANGLCNYGGYGGFWTSTVEDGERAYSLHFNNVYVDPTYGFNKSWGKAVRCVCNEQN